ncbi:uncharacterized protein LOC141627488 [Silene latifolia]|uniref:uncharacterized protein LOC141627488 n=1 Tax=Silene latifolia TaxID=37657 RepID=UPI003D7898FE
MVSVSSSLDMEDVRAGKLLVSSPQDRVAGMVEKMTETVSCPLSLCSEIEGNENNLLSHPVLPGCCGLNSSPDVPMKSDNGSAPDEASNGTQVCDSSSSTTSKLPQFRFTNKKRSHNTLHLSSQDYDSLLHGTHLGFYHPRSMSFMRVRTLPSKIIQMGTPHDKAHGTAEVPTSSPTPENSLHFGNIEPESVVLVKEEADVQVDKKTRLNSDSPYPTKISSIQFEFAAVRKLSLIREGPILHRYRAKDPMGCVSAMSKKRFMFSASFCRYARTSVAVMRRKWIYVHLIEFDAHYHPPFKKIRLVSSLGFTSTVSSVTSFGAPYAPSFVF